jgi:LacI family transcriptional regulator
MTSVNPPRSRANLTRATIKSVAERAGVSISTVSFVLNNRPGVSEETRQVVLEAARALQYIPDQAARELSAKQVRHIGLNASFGSQRLRPFQTLYREHLFGALKMRGFRPEEIPCRANGLPEQLAELMILTGIVDDDPRFRYLQAHNIPFVVLGHTNVPDVSWVVPDGFDGSRQAVEHLIRLGHTEILFLTGHHQSDYRTRRTFSHQFSNDRFGGYAAALSAANLEFNSNLVADSDFTTLGGFLAVRDAMRDGKKFSAVYAVTDELASGAIKAIEDAGLRVPTDISVVGFDDLPEVGEHFTTVHQDIERLADATVDLVLEALEGKPPRQITFPVHLVVRGTTAPKR